jgi:16S rRNA (cytosine1402-N4)-methyltransferase
MSSNPHVPVLLGPVLDGLDIKGDGVYVDGTFGRGGHSSAILERLNPRGRLIAFDRDPQAIAAAPRTLTEDPRFELIRGDYAQLAARIEERHLMGRVDGILLDLGVSSPQLDEAGRGFSFLRDGPLDMRMDPDAGVPASEWLADVDERELRNIIRKYGEERQAAKFARAIVKARGETPILTTRQLATVIAESQYPGPAKKIHPATKTFQAIRIFLNRELEQLEAVLPQTVDALARAGRLCVISFHSLEDRIVKRFMRNTSQEPAQYRGLPDIPAEFQPKLRLVGKAVKATADEIAANARARSARLRIAERL